jgi:hypothetical protein
LPLCSGRCRRAWLRGASLALFGAPPGPRTTTTLLASPLLLGVLPIPSGADLHFASRCAEPWSGGKSPHTHAHTLATHLSVVAERTGVGSRLPRSVLTQIAKSPNHCSVLASALAPSPSPSRTTRSHPRLSSLCVKSHLVMVSCRLAHSLLSTVTYARVRVFFGSGTIC